MVGTKNYTYRNECANLMKWSKWKSIRAWPLTVLYNWFCQYKQTECVLGIHRNDTINTVTQTHSECLFRWNRKKIGKRCPENRITQFSCWNFFFLSKFMCLLLDFDIYNVAIILSEFAWRMCGSFSSFFGWLQRHSMRIQLPFGPIFKARMEHVLRRRSAHFMKLFTFNKPKQQVKLWKKQPIFQNSSWITPGIVIMIWIHMI